MQLLINGYVSYFSSSLFYAFIAIIVGIILFWLFSWEYQKVEEVNANEEMSNQLTDSNQNNDNNLTEKEALNKLNNVEKELDRDDIKSYKYNENFKILENNNYICIIEFSVITYFINFVIFSK